MNTTPPTPPPLQPHFEFLLRVKLDEFRGMQSDLSREQLYVLIEQLITNHYRSEDTLSRVRQGSVRLQPIRHNTNDPEERI
jgi:hypothetical protein